MSQISSPPGPVEGWNTEEVLRFLRTVEGYEDVDKAVKDCIVDVGLNGTFVVPFFFLFSSFFVSPLFSFSLFLLYFTIYLKVLR